MIATIASERYKTMVVGGGDSWGYYSYLPALFIHDDLSSLQSTLEVRKSFNPHYVQEDANGMLRVGEAPGYGNKNVIKYTYGVSVFLAPAFVAAHVIALLSDSFVANGYSSIYILLLYLVIILYAAVGLHYLAKYLDHYLPTGITNWVVLTLAFATNLLYFITINNVMSHPVQFMLWSLLLYNSYRYFKEGRQMVSLIGMAVCIGFICIIRPVELFCVLIPLLYSFEKGPSGKTMLSEFFTPGYHKHLLIAVSIGLVILLPQLIYWYTQTGHLVYDSYLNENFDFTNCQWFAGLFSFNNGFFAYSPVMILSMVGISVGLRKQSKLMLTIIAIFATHAFISYSWWYWNYINGFGSRIMVEILPILALPLGYFIWTISNKWKWAYLVILLPCIGVNAMQTWQSHKGLLYTDYANFNYLRQTFGASSHELEHSVAYDLDMYQYDDYRCGETIYFNDFEKDDTLSAIKQLDVIGKHYYCITDSVEADFGSILIPNEDLIKNEVYQYLQFNFDLYIVNQVSGLWTSSVIDISYVKDNRVLESKNIRLFNKTGEGDKRSLFWGQTGVVSNVTAYVEPHQLVKEGADVKIKFYKQKGTPELFIDNYRISYCER
jgi:hypothetical protein